MKKALSILLSFIMLLSITAGIDLSAYAETSGDYEYCILDDGSIEITKYNGTDEAVTIPSTLDGYTVTSIGDEAFCGCESLTSITIPDTVTSIRNWAFLNCTSLVSITIPDSVTSIGDDTFFGCESLTSVTIPDSVTSIGKSAFNGCLSLTSIAIPNSVTSIGKWAFGYCRSLASITIPDSVTSIGDEAFARCESLTNVIIMNPNCKIYDDDKGAGSTIPNSATIVGYKNSTAHEYAKTHNNPFVAIECAHNYKTTTTKATLSKNGSVVTKCSVCGNVSKTTTIYYPKTIALSATRYTYDGKAKTPSVTVKDSKGNTLKKNTDYTVSYPSGRKNVGKYAVKITFKGNYSGSKTLYFDIVPKSTKITKITPKSKGFTVWWNKNTTQTTGYQIQYSTASDMRNAKTITVAKNTNYGKSLTGRLAKKRYYVRIRTYKTVKVNGKNTNLYSSWSKAKAVTTK